jgi:hypothetical protein
VALLFATAACGGGTDADGTGDTGGGANTAFTAYADCLKKNGVTITVPTGAGRNRPSGGPSGAPGGPGGLPSGMPWPSGSARPGGGGFPGGFGKPADVDDATWEKAQAACTSLRPSSRPGGRQGGGGMSAAYRTCLSDHGVTLGQSAPATADPAFRKAVEACHALAPTASAAPVG